jgi:hypothetical protein
LAIVAASFFDELSAPGSNDPAMAKARYHYNITLSLHFSLKNRKGCRFVA